MFQHLKHSRRSCRAYFPAWYSCPSITAVTVSESSTITATSLSLFPSMLRSLMLAEPAVNAKERDELDHRVHQQMVLRHQISDGTLTLFKRLNTHTLVDEDLENTGN